MPPTSEQLRNIQDQHLGLRSGTEAKNAAYGMSDFGSGQLLDIQRWVYNPALNHDRTQAWTDHLYNTILLIDALDKGKGYTLLIVKDAKLSNKERYNSQGGKGDKKTFQKTQLTPNSSIVKQKVFKSNEVDIAVDWVMDNI